MALTIFRQYLGWAENDGGIALNDRLQTEINDVICIAAKEDVGLNLPDKLPIWCPHIQSDFDVLLKRNGAEIRAEEIGP